MVAITPEEVMEMRREKKQLEEMSDWEMQQLPRGLRIDIPLRSTQHLKRITPLLRQFAEQVDMELRKKELSPVQTLNHIWGHNRSLRRLIEKICGTDSKSRD